MRYLGLLALAEGEERQRVLEELQGDLLGDEALALLVVLGPHHVQVHVDGLRDGLSGGFVVAKALPTSSSSS